MVPTLKRVAWTVAVAAAACGDNSATTSPNQTVARVPLSQLGPQTYRGFMGGLYPDGANTEPSAHSSAGLARAQLVTPLDTAGNTDAGGKIVLVSVGMSNTTQEFCSAGSTTTNCSSWTFMGQAAADVAVNHTTLVLANGARGGQTAQTWDSPTDANYDSIRLNRLQVLGVTEKQVQVAWVKVANATPRDSLPSTASDAYQLETDMGGVVRALMTRYPNLKLAFLSSRIYAGYASTSLNPEPYAYESGFAVKWLIEAQIRQMANGGTVKDPRAGTLNYQTGLAPWLGWGPYLWADGMTPRAGDGLTWAPGDLANDGTHPSQSGQQKVGAMLLTFFKGSPFTKCWFVVGGSCP